MKPRSAAARGPSVPRVLHVGAEVFPLLKTGGLADVLGALPTALRRAGVDARLLLPGFPSLLGALQGGRRVAALQPPWGGEAVDVVTGAFDVPSLAGLPVYLLRSEALYGRTGNPYVDADGAGHADNHRRFALLGLAAARLGAGLDPAWRAQVVHAHDWHAALAPAYLALHPDVARAASVYTVHNLAYQGLFPADRFLDLGLPADAYALQGLEFHGQVSFMKAGLHYADRLTTVSPTYAREIQRPDLGAGLDGLLSQRSGVLSGILNGVDGTVWNPATDRSIARTYDAGRLAGKSACKAALQREAGLAERDDVPLFTVVSRLTEQKGLHLVAEGLPAIVERGGQLVVLGSGDAALEAAFARAAAAHPQQVALRQGHDEPLAHRLFAASDVTLVPSRFEPCGLTQLYALAYGSLPLVRRTGGLADTVVDCTLEDLADGRATGFVFERFDSADFTRAIRRAFTLWARPREWHAVRERGMAQRFGWDTAAEHYLALYRELLGAK